MAQGAGPWAPPQNVLQLSATGTVEVPAGPAEHHAVSAPRRAADAAAVQAQLKQALDAALAEARKSAQPGQLDVRTGNFSLYPRYTPRRQDQRLAGHCRTGAGRARLRRASPRLAGRIKTLTVASIGYGLSREQRAKVGSRCAGAWPSTPSSRRPTELAKGFGFAGYTLREVSVNASHGRTDRRA